MFHLTAVLKAHIMEELLRRREKKGAYATFPMNHDPQSIQRGILVLEIVPVSYFGKKLEENSASSTSTKTKEKV